LDNKKGMERLNGIVGLESELGKGSTFWIGIKKHQSKSLRKRRGQK